jgi:hypothetical protein
MVVREMDLSYRITPSFEEMQADLRELREYISSAYGVEIEHMYNLDGHRPRLRVVERYQSLAELERIDAMIDMDEQVAELNARVYRHIDAKAGRTDHFYRVME